MKINELAKAVTDAQAALVAIETENDERDAKAKAALSAMPDGQPKSDAWSEVLDAQREGMRQERAAHRKLRSAVQALQTELDNVLVR